MRFTSRGWGVIVVIAFTVAASWQYGPRALDAVVIPLFVVLLTGLLTVVRVDRPRVRRAPVAEGFVGERRTVEVMIETDSSVAATVRDDVGNGLTAPNPTVSVTLEGTERIEYELALEARGDHQVGPLSIVVQDIFGLCERRFEYDETTRVRAYPRLYDLHGDAARDVALLTDVASWGDRSEFDHLREYQHGDSLQDVHWKSTAKRPGDELLVMESVADERTATTTVAAECTPGWEDVLAAATASVVTHLFERGTRVGVSVADGYRPPDAGREHYRSLLTLLAVTEAGELEETDRNEADVLVRSEATGTVIVVDGREIPFDRLRSGRKTGSSRNSLREVDV